MGKYWKGKKLSKKHRKKMSDAHKGLQANEKHWNWRGGKIHAGKGYIKIKADGHPNAKYNGYILEHRFVMSNMLGRPLRKGEYVHHKNGKRNDNRPTNLELVQSHNHTGRIKCPFCQKSFLVR